jgi:hypothetical protein
MTLYVDSVFGRNAQIPVIARGCAEWGKSTQAGRQITDRVIPKADVQSYLEAALSRPWEL